MISDNNKAHDSWSHPYQASPVLPVAVQPVGEPCLLCTPCTYAIHAAPETWRMAGITSPNTNVLVIQVNVCSLHCVRMPSMQHLKHGGWPGSLDPIQMYS